MKWFLSLFLIYSRRIFAYLLVSNTKKTIPLENVTYVRVCDSLLPREMINDFVYFLLKVALKYTVM